MLNKKTIRALVVLDGELAVPRNPKSAYAGSKILQEIFGMRSLSVVLGEEVDLT